MLILAAAGYVRADIIVWDGGLDGTGASWNDPANWAGDVIPGAGDTAAFTDAGLSAGKVITLDAAQTNAALSIDTTLNFTIGDSAGNTAGHTLSIAAVERSAGSDGTHSLVADLLLDADTLWTLEGSGLLNANKIIGSGVIEKQGSCELRLNGNSSSRSGATIINSGTLSATNQKQLGTGDLTVGNGIDPATFLSRWNSTWNIDLIGGNADILVKSNGVFDLESVYNKSSTRTDYVGSLTVEQGGVVKLGKWGIGMSNYTATNVTLSGGSLTATPEAGYLSPVSGTVLLTTNATEMMTLESAVKVSYKYSAGAIYTKFNVNDIEDAPVDLKVTGVLVNSWDDRDGYDKVGSGVLKVTGNNTYGGDQNGQGATRIQVGTLLVDNTEGSGTGRSNVKVSGGATLGGIGTIGGVLDYEQANVSASGTSGNPAMVAPGTIDEVTGEHLAGTLTVGGAAQTNNVTFGSDSTLLIHIAANGTCDKLAVNGTLSLATTSDALELDVASPQTLAPGTYTLVEFQQLAEAGQIFDTVTGVPSQGELVYTATSIGFVINPKGLVITIQ